MLMSMPAAQAFRRAAREPRAWKDCVLRAAAANGCENHRSIPDNGTRTITITNTRTSARLFTSASANKHRHKHKHKHKHKHPPVHETCICDGATAGRAGHLFHVNTGNGLPCHACSLSLARLLDICGQLLQIISTFQQKNVFFAYKSKETKKTCTIQSQIIA